MDTMKKIEIKFIGILLFVSFSCSCRINESNPKIEFDNFSINLNNVKSNFIEETDNGIYGEIVWNDLDTIYFQLGHSIRKLSEPEPNIVYVPNGINLTDLNLQNKIVTRKLNYDIDRFRKQNARFETIDGYSAKIVYPRLPRNGIVGVYIDSLWPSKSAIYYDNIAFNLYSTNISEDKEKTLLAAISTLKFFREK